MAWRAAAHAAGRSSSFRFPVLATAGSGVAALWLAKALKPPEAGDRAAWWRNRTWQAQPASEEAAAADKATKEALLRAGLPVEQLCAAARATWSGIELCAEEAVASSSSSSAEVARWRAIGALDACPPVTLTPESKKTYAQDVGCAAPSYLDLPLAAPRLHRESQLAALSALEADGMAVITGAVPELHVRRLRKLLRILGGASGNACPPEVRTSEVLAGTGAAEGPVEPSSGRRHFLLRGTALAERELVPLLSPLMPLIYRFFARQRPEDFPGLLLLREGGAASVSAGTPVPRLFVSECQLLVSDPGAVTQIWHRDNRRCGLTVIFPLTDVDDEVGPTQLLPGTQHLASNGLAGLTGALPALAESAGAQTAGPLQPGDALIYDARVLHRGLRNASYGRCRVVVVLRLDYTDTPPPGGTWLHTSLARLGGHCLYAACLLYSVLPVPERVAAGSTGDS